MIKPFIIAILSCFILGVAGCVYAMHYLFISPDSVFGFSTPIPYVFGAERTRLGLPAATHPIRRDVAFGPNPDNALAGFAARTAARYRGYATNERSGYGAVSLESLARHVVHGTVEDCVTAVRGLASQLPIGPLIVRPQWPGMTTAEVVSYLDQLGGLVDGLRGLEPTR